MKVQYLYCAGLARNFKKYLDVVQMCVIVGRAVSMFLCVRVCVPSLVYGTCEFVCGFGRSGFQVSNAPSLGFNAPNLGMWNTHTHTKTAANTHLHIVLL